MKYNHLKFRCILAISILSFFHISNNDVYAQDRSNSAEEMKIYKSLESISPISVDIFREATEAMDNSDYEVAINKYELVLEKAPDFVPALRRLSYVVQDKHLALKYARKAYELEKHIFNTTAVIRALLEFDDKKHITEALMYARDAASEVADDFYVQTIVCQAAVNGGDEKLLNKAVANLEGIAPNEIATHYYAGIAAAISEKWEKAEKEILMAKELGLPDSIANDLMDKSGIRNKALKWRFVKYSILGFIIWIVGLVILLLSGMALSKMTMIAIEEQDTKKLGEATGIVLLMRRLYAVIITLTSVYFYISIPIIIILVLGTGSGIIYSFYLLGRIPIKLIIIVGAVMLVTLYAFIKSLLIRPIYEDPGYRLDAKDAPHFFSALREVASKVNAPMVDSAYITSDASIAVFERGSFWKRLSGAKERCLILGLGVLKDMTQLQLKSVLAHEFGHISNRDTAGGSMALHVRRSIHESARALAGGGAAVWYNPAWIFLNAFYRIYLRVSQGASRLQEVLADQWAALLFGSDAFVKGFKHVIKRSIEFDLVFNIEIDNAIKEKRQLKNLFILELQKEWPKAVKSNVNWASRIPCSDESCIGIIGPDGLCKECGKCYEGEELRKDIQLNTTTDSTNHQANCEDEEAIEQADAVGLSTYSDKNDDRVFENEKKEVKTPGQTVEEAFVKTMEETTSPYDSHPSPKQRIEWVSKLNIKSDIIDEGKPAWFLLDNSEILQDTIIRQLNENVQNYANEML